MVITLYIAQMWILRIVSDAVYRISVHARFSCSIVDWIYIWMLNYSFQGKGYKAFVSRVEE